MYNLNVNMATSAAVSNLLSVENSCNTPRTPEILNSLIAMTNPMDNWTNEKSKRFHSGNLSSDSNSSSCSSPTASNAPTSVQQTCSQLIKAGLKLSIEQKRKSQTDTDDLLDLDLCSKRIKTNESESEEDKYSQCGGARLTPEDEERRRRRRERNKIAATKCRLKKRERTANLVVESETLETQNVELKSQIKELQAQRAHLADILSMHRTSCHNNIRPASKEVLFNNRLPPVNSVIENNHSYSRPSSVDSFRTQNLDTFNRPASTGTDSSYNTRNSIQYLTKPSIIIESDDNYEPNLTNLDNPIEVYSFNNQQCHNYQTNQQNYGIDSCMA